MRSRVWCAPEALLATTSSGVENQLDVFVKPRKMVKTKAPVLAGQLRLVPEPSAVKIVKVAELGANDPAPAGLWEVALTDPPSGFDSRVFLASGGSDSVSAFWHVEATTREEEANLTVLWYRVQSLQGADPLDSKPAALPYASAAGEESHASAMAATLAPSPERREEAVPSRADSFSKARPSLPPQAIVSKAPPASAPPAASASPLPPSEDASRKRVAMSAAMASSDAPFDRFVFVPVLGNTTALPAGTTLLVWQEAVASKPRKAARPISVAQLAKKARAF